MTRLRAECGYFRVGFYGQGFPSFLRVIYSLLTCMKSIMYMGQFIWHTLNLPLNILFTGQLRWYFAPKSDRLVNIDISKICCLKNLNIFTRTKNLFIVVKATNKLVISLLGYKIIFLRHRLVVIKLLKRLILVGLVEIIYSILAQCGYVNMWIKIRWEISKSLSCFLGQSKLNT